MNGERTASGESIVNDRYTRSSAAGSGGWRTAGGGSVRGDVRYSSDDRGFPGPFGSDPGGTFAGVDAIARGTDNRWLTSIAGVVPMGTRVRTQAQVSYGWLDGRFVSSFGPSQSGWRRGAARVQSDVTVSPGIDVSAGFELQRERARSSYFTGASSQEIPITRQVEGYFAEGRWNRSQRVFVTAGVRVDDIRRDALEADPFAPRPAFPADAVVSTSPKVSAAWFVRPGAATFTKIRASAGTGIRPPDGFEIAFTDNPGLKPERSTSTEIGVDQAIAGGLGLLEATAFVNKYDDLIVAVGSFRESSRFRTDNISNARARGLELAGTGRRRIDSLDLQLHVAYTFLDTEVLAVDRSRTAPPPFKVGDPLLRRPRHQISLVLQLNSRHAAAYVQGGGRARRRP
jgi:outer membrane receptor protein involved in Fe transport